MKQVKLFGLFLLLLALLFLWGAVFYPYPAQVPSGGSLEPPNPVHWLGTDDLGTDIFAQISVGFYSSMAIGMAAAGVSFLLGGALGVLGGYRGGAVDTAASFCIHLFLSVPQLPIMIVIGAFFGQNIWNIILIVSLFSWAPIAKIVRERTIEVRKKPFIRQAESYGGTVWYLLRTHMAGEILPLLTVNSLAVIGKAIIQESSLAYLGLSDPLSKSWGLMISKCVAFKGIYFTDYWMWWLIPPVTALILTILCVRLLSKELERIWVN